MDGALVAWSERGDVGIVLKSSAYAVKYRASEQCYLVFFIVDDSLRKGIFYSSELKIIQLNQHSAAEI